MRITVTVKPNARQSRVVETGEHAYTVYVHAPPRGGAANERLLHMLAEYFHVAPTSLILKRGKRSRLKIIEMP